MTVQRDDVTASVTNSLEPSSSPSQRPIRGTLALVTVAARDAQRDGSREHRTPATLPAAVRELCSAWNELAAPHGFPAWGERTSGRLLQDALAALERRPLEEWRRVFALVPRSPVCCGELSSRQRASLVWMLTGRTRDGYEPAEKLLSGTWSIDPEPTATPAANTAGAELAGLPVDTPAASAWKQMLEAMQEDGKKYALSWLARLRGRAVQEGELVLEAPDTYAATWVAQHYGELVRRMAAIQGYTGVRFIAAGEASP
ncbi:hypothetical protein F0U61_20805 [Archangium violaceum]|uniref:DnaA N-terminal domain-containing protein n=1 Tax=Archangium violaceum TaxID=83451 RepID=UPI002B2D2296|nr:hypothetical protein F0U61_20805 [Archangium violaceum]